MGQIQVTSATLKSKADQLKQYNKQFKNNVKQLESAEGSLNSMWDGPANDAFHKAFHNDKVQMDNFYNAIEAYVNALLKIAAQYQKAENQNVTTANKRTYK